jgi:DNA invertase Pin-like site-specific DNA recombinase
VSFILGYARVSTNDKTSPVGETRLESAGAFRFEDVISGKTVDRPGLAVLRSIRKS